jgi:multiple sugar transport system permease protein
LRTFVRGAPTFCFATIAVVIFLFPIFWMISTSFKPADEAISSSPTLVFLPTLKNYVDIWAKGLSLPLSNSLVIAASSTALSIALGSLSAYSLSRFKFHGSKFSAYWIISTRMAPAIAFVLPIYLLMKSLGLLDTQVSMIIAHTTFNLPLAVWILRGYFAEIPADMEESAMVDGCSRMGALFRIVMPVAVSGVVATAVICFVFSWNEFMFALVLTGINAKTLPLLIAGVQTQRRIMWGEMTAMGTLVIVPAFLVTALLRKHLLRGLAFGAVKG